MKITYLPDDDALQHLLYESDSDNESMNSEQ